MGNTEVPTALVVVVLAIFATIPNVLAYLQLRRARKEAGRGVSFLIAAQTYADHLTALLRWIDLLGKSWGITLDREMAYALLRAEADRVLRSNPELKPAPDCAPQSRSDEAAPALAADSSAPDLPGGVS